MAYGYYGGGPNVFSFISGAFSATTYIVTLILSILVIIGRWKMYEKAGEHGWASLIPIYSEYVLFRIAWGSGWMVLVMLIPIVNVVFAIILSLKLARAFGMGTGFGIGLILLPSIFYLILGFSDAKYLGPED